MAPRRRWAEVFTCRTVRLPRGARSVYETEASRPPIPLTVVDVGRFLRLPGASWALAGAASLLSGGGATVTP